MDRDPEGARGLSGSGHRSSTEGTGSSTVFSSKKLDGNGDRRLRNPLIEAGSDKYRSSKRDRSLIRWAAISNSFPIVNIAALNEILPCCSSRHLIRHFWPTVRDAGRAVKGGAPSDSPSGFLALECKVQSEPLLHFDRFTSSAVVGTAKAVGRFQCDRSVEPTFEVLLAACLVLLDDQVAELLRQCGPLNFQRVSHFVR